ncbi:MAG: sensor histidine kinase [Rhodothermales bacterium]
MPAAPSPLSPPRPWPRSAEWAAILGFWVLLGTLTLVRRALDPRGPAGLSAPDLLLTISEYVFWAALTPVVFAFVRRYPLEQADWARRLVVHLLLAFAVAAAVEVALLLIVRPMILAEFPRLGRMDRFARRIDPGRALARLQFLDELVIYLAILATGFARDYFLRFRERQAEAARLLTETTRLQAQLAEARLSALRMQLNPHFLFNTLHAVSALVERDPGGVRRIVARLSTLLRRALDDATPQEVPLRDELDFLRGYFDIQRVRFQDRLEIDEAVPPPLLDALVPNLILQPLAENAVEHGVSRLEHGTGQVEIAARRDGAMLVVTIRDNGPGLGDDHDGERSERGGVGLRNVRARLGALYGDAAHLTLTTADGGGSVATVTLPYHTASDLRTSARPDA